jgi:hypothetical protein
MSNVKIVNRAAPITSALKRTDKLGRFTAERFSAGNTEFHIGKTVKMVNLKPETTNEITLEAP